MENIFTSITYIFSQKKWENKIVPLLIALVVFGFISTMFSFMFQVPLEIMSAALKDAGQDATFTKTLSSMVSSFVSFVSLPLTFYILGYAIDVVKNIAKDKEEVLPEHTDIWNTFVKGLKLYAATFIATLPTTIIGVTILISTAVGTIITLTMARGNVMVAIFGVFLSLLTLLLTVVLSVLNNVITYSSWNIYYQTNSFRAACNFGNIIKTIKNNERALLKLFLDFILLGILQLFMSIGAFLLICISFITLPAVTLIGYFARAYLIGQAFKKISKLEIK